MNRHCYAYPLCAVPTRQMKANRSLLLPKGPPKASELRLGLLVHEPDDFGRVHGRAAAQPNDDVGLEGVGLTQALLDAGPRRAGGHLQQAVAGVEGSVAQRAVQAVRTPPLDAGWRGLWRHLDQFTAVCICVGQCAFAWGSTVPLAVRNAVTRYQKSGVHLKQNTAVSGGRAVQATVQEAAALPFKESLSPGRRPDTACASRAAPT